MFPDHTGMDLKINKKKLEKFTNWENSQHTPKHSKASKKKNHKKNEKIL